MSSDKPSGQPSVPITHVQHVSLVCSHTYTHTHTRLTTLVDHFSVWNTHTDTKQPPAACLTGSIWRLPFHNSVSGRVHSPNAAVSKTVRCNVIPYITSVSQKVFLFDSKFVIELGCAAPRGVATIYSLTVCVLRYSVYVALGGLFPQPGLCCWSPQTVGNDGD